MKARGLNNLLCYYTENDVSTKVREKRIMIKERYTNVDLKITLFHLVHVKMMP